jgi:general transcription factor 3C polypeptide 5 (transcription factor C subunit 1)
VESLRKFKLDPSIGVKENDELIPPPTFSDKNIPINWGYHQNPNIKFSTDQQTGETILTNQSRAPKINTYYVPYDTPTVPTHPPALPPPDPILQSLLTDLRVALTERPVWTRRAILNRIPRSNPGIYLLKPAIQYVAYQFRGGPWRDAIVRYGIDPRSSPEYRIYQTLFFKIVEYPPQPATSDKQQQQQQQLTRQPWHNKRSEYTRKAHPDTLGPNSHIFDGKGVSLDGKIWQVCDITDPLLARLLSTPVLRSTCDLHSDGWFCNGTWAKVRAVMRTKITAIRLGREMLESDFRQTLLMPDDVKDKARPTAWMPNLGFAANSLAADDDAEDGSEVEDWVRGTTGLVRTPGTSAKAWRRRKIRGIKKRNRRRLDGTANMGFGRARKLGTLTTKPTKIAKDKSALGNEANSIGDCNPVEGESSALDRPDINLDAFDGAEAPDDEENVYGNEELDGEGDDNEGDEELEGIEDDNEEGGEEEDEDDDEDDEELDGEGW